MRKEKTMKLRNIVTGIAFTLLVICASGLDDPRWFNWIGIAVSIIWLGYAGIRRIYGQRTEK